MRRVAVGGVVAAMFVCAVFAQARADSPAAGIEALVRAYEGQSRATAGVCITDLRSGKTIVQFSDAEAMIPASNQKLLTSAFALERLGAGFHFKTGVYLRGPDVIVVGDFDPTLGDPAMAKASGDDIYAEPDKWAAAIKHKIGAKLTGDIILRVRPGAPLRHDDWPKNQFQQRYAAPVAQLNFYNNCFGVTFQLSEDKVVAKVEPASYLISVTSSLKRGRSHLWSLRCTDDDASLLLKGTIKTATSDPWLSAANDPPMLLGRVLADRLKRAGVTLRGKVTTAGPEQTDVGRTEPIAQTLTPLADVMSRANKHSINMAAECIFLRAGDGTWPGSAKLMARTLTKTFGLAEGDLAPRDGAGLSRHNRVTPRAIAKILADIAAGKDAAVFTDSLPVSGEDGTMRTRLKRPDYADKVRAKTGYISGVSCLSGYVLDPAGARAYAFSILINNVPDGKGYIAKALQDDICRLLVDSLGK